MNLNQVVVRFVLKSDEIVSSSSSPSSSNRVTQIYSIELNLIENANIKLVRDQVRIFYFSLVGKF